MWPALRRKAPRDEHRQTRPAQFRRHRRPARPGGRLRQLGAVRVCGAGACRRAPCNEGALAAVGSTLIELAFASIPHELTTAGAYWASLLICPRLLLRRCGADLGRRDRSESAL